MLGNNSQVSIFFVRFFRSQPFNQEKNRWKMAFRSSQLRLFANHQDQCDSDCPSDTEPGTEPTVAKGIELQVQESVRDDQRSIYSLPSQHSNASHDLSDARKVRWEMTRRRICDEVHMKDLDFLPFFPVN